MNLGIAIEQVSILGVVMLIGFISVKSGYLNSAIKEGLSKLIVRITLPCLIISSISEKELTPDILANVGTVLGLSVFTLVLLFLIGKISSKIFGFSGARKTVHTLLFTLGNVIFLAYPVITAIYGEEGFFYAIIYWLVNDLFLWTGGVFMLNKDIKTSDGNAFKKLINPNTVSFVIAILMFVFRIKLPGILGTAVGGVGSLTTYISMIFVGMALAGVDLRKILKNGSVFVITAVKQVIIPVLLILLFRALGTDSVILGAVVLQAAMPAQTVLTILANEYGSDFEYSAIAMFVTTAASLFTLPLVCWFIDFLI